MTAPDTLRAGDSATWIESAPSHPAADGWDIKARVLFKSSAAAVDLTGTPDGPDTRFTLSATATAAWPAGQATLILYAERGAGPALERATLGTRPLQVQPNLLTAANHDGRSLARRTLVDLEAALAQYAGSKGHVQSYSIAGRTMQFRSVAEIRELIAHYKDQVAAETAHQALLAGGSPGRVISKL